MAALLQARGGWRSLRIQVRVVHALILREIITRYGRHNIGFMWIFVEPMMFTLGVLALYLIYNHHTQLPIIPFTVSGYSTVLLWRNTINRCGNALHANRSLLHHRNVRVIDFFAARLLLEVAGASMSFLTLATILTAVGAAPVPDDVLKMIAGWGLLAWFAMAMGLIVGCLSGQSETFERIWHVFTYLFLGASGAFFMVEWLPSRIQPLAEFIPTVDATELLREGYFGAAVHAHYDVAYLLTVNCVLTFIGLVTVKRLADTVEGA
jgi:capsular polysaccharide transport system permease protein